MATGGPIVAEVTGLSARYTSPDPNVPISGQGNKPVSTSSTNLRYLSVPQADGQGSGFGFVAGPLTGGKPAALAFSDWLNRNNSFNFDNVGTFNVSDLRDLFQLQKWMERNARAGTRYIEFLKAHYGVSPSDSRLDRPEFLGSVKSSVIISEVLQTSQSSAESAQGNLAGKGLGVSKSYIDRYYVDEPGVIIGLTCVYPRPSYQQGINRVWLRKTRLEQFYPEFVNLSEQGIKLAELYATNNAKTNNKIFGYTGIYDEMRVRHPQVCGDLRDTLDYWVMTRKFNKEPALNSEFITCNPSKNIFAVQDEPGVILNIYNDITAIRSIPFISEPGLIDHH